MPQPNPTPTEVPSKEELRTRADRAVRRHRQLYESAIADLSDVMLAHHPQVAEDIADMARWCQSIQNDQNEIDQLEARVKRDPRGAKTDVFGHAAALLLPENIEEEDNAAGLSAKAIRTQKTRLGNTMRFLVAAHGDESRDQWIELIRSATTTALSDRDVERREAVRQSQIASEVKKLEEELTKLRRKGIGEIDLSLHEAAKAATAEYDRLYAELNPPDAPKRRGRKKVDPRLAEAEQRKAEAIRQLDESDRARIKMNDEIGKLDKRIERLKGETPPKAAPTRAGLPVARYQEAMSAIDHNEVVRLTATFDEDDALAFGIYADQLPMLAVIVGINRDTGRIVLQLGEKSRPQQIEEAARQGD